MDEMLEELAREWQHTEVITSPSARPAVAAGEPDSVPWTSAPEGVPPVLPPVLPKPPSELPDELPAAETSTPRNAVVPMWTVEEAVPASICLATVMASLIGME